MELLFWFHIGWPNITLRGTSLGWHFFRPYLIKSSQSHSYQPSPMFFSSLPIFFQLLLSTSSLFFLWSYPHHLTASSDASLSIAFIKFTTSISYWPFLLSINLKPHIALVIDLFILLKITNLFFLIQHVSLSYMSSTSNGIQQILFYFQKSFLP